MAYRAVLHASEVLTGAGIRIKDGRHVHEEDIGRIEDGAIVYNADEIEWVGPTAKLPKKYARAKKLDLKGKQAVVPGFVDCHTHLVFAGDRSVEFALRCGGASYEEIAAKGGGILTSVLATRQASVEALEKLAVPRVREAQSFGVRTLEIKSGYGLTLESELKCLEVVKRLKKKFPKMTLRSTFLGAHAFPKERTRDEYLSDLIDKMLPMIARKKLADACDVFVDPGYFTVDEARKILGCAKEWGLPIKMHADELANTESAAVAAEMKCLSADHLLKISERGIAKLASSNTVAVLLPGTAFYLKAEHAPARKLIQAGACVALSTDFNPGTCMTLNLPAVMTIAALYLGMSRSEILASVTYNAAKALGLHDRKGTLEPGMDPDFAILPFARFEEAYYRFAWTERVR
jgi:imidazolonepropionase